LPTLNRTAEVDSRLLNELRTAADDLLIEAPSDADGESDTIRFTQQAGPFERYERELQVETIEPDRHRVSERVEFRLAAPFWRPLVHLAIRFSFRRRFRDPVAVRRHLPWWAPPSRFDQRNATVLSLLAAVSMVVAYLGVLLSQTITFAADEFGASDRTQGTTLAAVRVGVFLALGLITLADRVGRKPILVGAVFAAVLVTATGAFAPSLFWYGASQAAARAFTTAAAVIVGIIAAEEVPAGARAYAVSILALVGALGSGVAVWFLFVADLDPRGWRILFLLPLFTLPALWRFARALPESIRFRAHVETGSGAIGGRIDRRRFVLVALLAFLLLFFNQPASQFRNEFLRDERGFTAVQITLFTVFTNAPAGIGVYVGGRLADAHGRRIVGAVALVAGTILTVISYRVSGTALWVWGVVNAVVSPAVVPALGVYSSELFATARRGRANGLMTLIAVVGSSSGLLVAGYLADSLGGLGSALPLLAIAPIVLAGIVLTSFPETAGAELETLNPSDRRPDQA